jgi:predicted helicase
MMAPYAVGHLKMSFFLEELGHRLGDDERFPFYLTNTLEMEELAQTHLPGMASLSQESHLAGEVKKQRPILVVLGNPPYSGHSSNRGPWILKLIEDYKRLDGKPLGEKNPKWLQDDYVKFLRFAQWKIAQTGQGLVGMITNHSYRDNPTFRGMRQSLMRTFDEIYLLDLHGNSLKRETCPDGSKDENVFDIQQGVAIAFFIKRKPCEGSEPSQGCSVYHADRWGLREDKYDWLLNHDVATTDWQEIRPKPEFHLFVPRDEAALECYDSFTRVTAIFPVNSVGIVTARDSLTIHWTPEDVWTTVLNFSRLDPELARQAYKLGEDARDWKVKLAQEDLKSSGLDKARIVPILYRPFDVRYTYYTGKSRGFQCMPRPEVMRHMLAGGNVALITPRQHKDEFGAYVTRVIGTHKTVAAYDINYYFPLYLYPDASQKSLFSDLAPGVERKPNLNPKVVAALTAAYGQEPTPEDIFSYVYAVLYAPAYREKYAAFLKTDFPRLPFTANFERFQALAALGKRLVDLHLLRSGELDPPAARFEGKGDYRVARGLSQGLRYEPKEERVYINKTQYFAPVPLELWEYQIGGYQVLEKWLKDRQDRPLALEEIKTYCRVVTAIQRTIALQEEIDALYPEAEARIVRVEG